MFAEAINNLTCTVTHKNITQSEGVLVLVVDKKNPPHKIVYCVKDIETLKKLPACPVSKHVGDYHFIPLKKLSAVQCEQAYEWVAYGIWDEGENNIAFYRSSFSTHHKTTRGVNFQNVNLSGSKLSGADFSGANFSGANLADTDFSHANLSKAQFISANLKNANLKNANLSYANFMKADLQGAQLECAMLTGADFNSAQLSHANLNQSVLQHESLTPVSPVPISGENIHLPSLQKPYDQLKRMAFYDLVTDVYNRQAFDEFFEQEILSSARYNYGCAIFFIDLDHFKEINDTYGHLTGDVILKEVATRLKKIVRQGDLISRFGGDEFIIYFKSIDDDVDPGHFAQKMITALSDPYHVNQAIIKLSASIGICYWQSSGQLTASDILSRADIALYRAKSKGRNGYHYYSKFLHKKHEQHAQSKNSIETAIRKQQFELHYQPIYKIKHSEILGFEAMSLFKTKNKLITDAEQISQSIDDSTVMEMFIKKLLEESCQYFSLQSAERSRTSKFLQLHINFSPLQMTHEKFSDILYKNIAAAHIQCNQINIEISESQLKMNAHTIISALNTLQDKGIHIVLDHFTGDHFSLTELKNLPISKIKIARHLIDQLDTDRQKKIVVQSIIQLAASLKIFCIADGVYQEAQAELLKQLGCEAVQGSYYGEPVVDEAV